MNVYQKILVKLSEITSGKSSEKVDFRELIKSEGFYPSYDDIFKQMSQQGWITESGREDIIAITPWGVKEAKKLQSGVSDDSRELQRSANRLRESAKEFLVMVEEFAGEVNEEHFKSVENKFGEIKEAIEQLKPNF